ncbi:gfo/Idh/MocA family oxidoreductase [Verminephrobacter eiseniae]|uniref:Gfo/Idh/MocA family protein n=1 Tax=Verminephrobacter eiseniae TaxID=364317 RepID=UPI002238A790|nr:Gfo/Idh/MocA family oxidoreductase [Verminephrobacter eiseniae]MCW5263305.1 gfo/Idh/MocA family oxidoreductase [Verminephrobacter eiseniae]
MTDIQSLQQEWPLPSRPRPVVIIGAGGIVNDAHLPAYKKAGFFVQGVYDLDTERAKGTAAQWGIGRVYETLEQAVSETGVVFDLALPPSAVMGVLDALPDGAVVLIQKPMGKDLAQARAIVAVCQRKKLLAAINHQLRFAPYMLAVRDAIGRGCLGSVSDVEMQLNVADPWHLFPFLETMERVEIQVHSIHYLDLIRSLLGDPAGVYALTIADARYPRLKSTRSSIILNYGSKTRVCLSLNHNYAHGEKGQSAMFKFEGTDGVMWVQLGVMLDYPEGRPDTVQVKLRGQDWKNLMLTGSWFPDAFIGPMSNLQRFSSGEDSALLTDVHDVLRTMVLVEAAYVSSASGGTPLCA